MSSRGTTRETEVEREVFTQVVEGAPGMPRGTTQGGRAGCRQRELDLGLILQLGSLGGALWAAWRKAGFVNSHHEEWRFDKLHGGLISGHTRGRSGKAS